MRAVAFHRTSSLADTRSSATAEGPRYEPTNYVSKIVLCFTFTRCGFNQQKWPPRSFKGIGNGAIR